MENETLGYISTRVTADRMERDKVPPDQQWGNKVRQHKSVVVLINTLSLDIQYMNLCHKNRVQNKCLNLGMGTKPWYQTGLRVKTRAPSLLSVAHCCLCLSDPDTPGINMCKTCTAHEDQVIGLVMVLPSLSVTVFVCVCVFVCLLARASERKRGQRVWMNLVQLWRKFLPV